MATGKKPDAIIDDPATSRVFVFNGGGDSARVIEAAAGKLQARSLLAEGEGTITVIQQETPDKFSVVENVKTLPRAKTMALDPRTHQLFLSTAEAGQFEVLVVEKLSSPAAATRAGGGTSN